MRASFHPAAAEELADAAAYYERRVEGLGEQFVDEVEAVVARLTEFPALGAMVDSIHRRIIVRRFPFSLFYRADESEVRVIAVAHQRRRPGYWRTRK